MEQQAFQDQVEVDTRFPDRTGWPRLPVLPLQEVKLPKDAPQEWHTDVEQIDHDQVAQILADNNVANLKVSVACRYNDGVPVSERKPALLVRSDIYKEGQDIENWRQAVRDLREMFRKRRINNVTIEITDVRVVHNYNFVIQTDPIRPGETDLLKEWTTWAPRVAQCLSGHNFLSIELLHRHNFLTRQQLHRDCIGAQEDPEATVDATVVICAADANDDRWWDETIPELRRLLPSNLGIELLYLRTIFALDGKGFFPEPWFPLSEEAYNKIVGKQLADIQYEIAGKQLADIQYDNPESVHLGASCGRKWKGKEHGMILFAKDLSLDSGTLGGFIKLEGEEKPFGLSNHHVFFEGQDYDGNEKEKILEPLSPSTLQSPENEITICSPSIVDLGRIKERYRKELFKITKKWEDKPRFPAHDDGSDDLPFLPTGKEVESLSKRKDIVDRLLPEVGTVYASSGDRSVHNEAMKNRFWETWKSDWCLLKMTAEKEMSNKVPRLSDEKPASATVYQSIRPSEKYDVVKFGRTSGRTAGIISAADTVLRKPDELASVAIFDKKNTSVPRKEIEGEETPTMICHSICSRNENEASVNQSFMQDGDSGCFILLNHNESAKEMPIVGLGFGRSGTNTAYMMPFDLVVKDIEDVTGKKVIWPKYGGQAKANAQPTNDEPPAPKRGMSLDAHVRRC